MKRNIYMPFTAAIIAFTFTLVSCKLAPGSYPYAELYEIDSSEINLVKAIEKFKVEYPEYSIPVQVILKDGRRNESDHWYHIYFYYKKENEIVKAWIRKSNKNTTTFAFVAINEGLTLGNWKDINKSYSRKDNKFQKEKFEHLILEKIKEKLQ